MTVSYKVLKEKTYQEKLKGITIATDNMVSIKGERTIELEDGRVIEQYLYDIDEAEPTNKQPYAALKENIVLIK